ncbi:MAG: hypothetical protein JO021_06635, partial [Alphaproteobacteria bacterium]|nr:hypothetical protein [Alphaproteobacteria bacterium]
MTADIGGMVQPLARVPVAFFAIVLGVLGLGTTWREAARLWGAPAWIGEAIVMLGVAIWL